MSIAFVTTRGSFVIDLFLKKAPMLGFNMLKLAKIGWFNNALIFEIIPDFFVKIGHISIPGGKSIYQLLTNNDEICIPDELIKGLTHSKAGYVSTCNLSKDDNKSDFFITLGHDLSRFDNIRSIFGIVSENFDLIKSISKEFIDSANRPYRNIRILLTKVICDPFDDPMGFDALLQRFVPFERIKELDRLEDDEKIVEVDPERERKRQIKMKEQRNAEILVMLGDIPSIDSHPPDTSLFICKLHPRTTEDGLKIVFSKFGTVENVDLIKDKKTGDSLCYGFINFSKPSEAENAFMKMQHAVIDNRMIHVDFSQSIRGSKNLMKKI